MKITLEGSELALNKFLNVQRTYMKRKGIGVVKSKPINSKPDIDTNSELYKITKLFVQKFNKEVPRNKINDINWIKNKLND